MYGCTTLGVLAIICGPLCATAVAAEAGSAAPRWQLSTTADSVTQRTQKQAYDVSLPEGWDKYVSVGKFTVASQPFYSPAPALTGTWPQVLCYWSLKNLTADSLYIEVNYGGRFLEGPGGTGLNVGYLLRPHESKEIWTLVPFASATRPTSLRIQFYELRLPKQQFLLDGQYCGLTTGNLVVSPSAPGDFRVANEDKQWLHVSEPKLARSEKGEYLLEVSVSNPSEKDARVVVQTSVSDPFAEMEPGTFAEREIVVKGRNAGRVQVPYTFPPNPGDNPLLTYRAAEVPDAAAGDTAALGLMERNLEYLSRGGNVLSAGSIDLLSAAKKGLVTLPEFKRVPVEERVKLTEQKQSEHFLFRYRPDSYAAKNIEQVIKDREEAYRKLKGLLQMDLPAIVTIDLYPDMGAKGLGSGTTWTPANTVTNTHIAEVCNESSPRVDPNHELAHIFTFNFGGGGEGVLVEPFAASCEAYYDIPKMMKAAGQRLSQGKLSSLESILLSSKETWGEDTMVFIHYLIKLDLAKFKSFYVRMKQVNKREDLDKVLREVYGTDLPGLERQWHAYLSQDRNQEK